jgi:hypothetical protein
VTADASAPVELTRFIDALGRRVTAELTRSGLVVILTRTPDKGLNGGPPALNPANARQLIEALTPFAAGEGP